MMIGTNLSSQEIFNSMGDSPKYDVKASFKSGDLESFILKELLQNKMPPNGPPKGYVLISFTIAKDGSLTDIDPIDFPNKEVGLNSVMALQATDGMWNPTIYKNNPIDYQYFIAYNYSVNIDSGPPEYFDKANKLYGKNDFKKALKYYNKAIKINKYFADPYLKRSLAKKALGDMKGADEDQLRYEKLNTQFVGNINSVMLGITRTMITRQVAY